METPKEKLVLKTEVEYEEALRKYAKFFDNNPWTEEQAEIADAVVNYQEEHYPVEPASEEEIEAFKKDQNYQGEFD